MGYLCTLQTCQTVRHINCMISKLLFDSLPCFSKRQRSELRLHFLSLALCAISLSNHSVTKATQRMQFAILCVLELRWESLWMSYQKTSQQRLRKHYANLEQQSSVWKERRQRKTRNPKSLTRRRNAKRTKKELLRQRVTNQRKANQNQAKRHTFFPNQLARSCRLFFARSLVAGLAEH